MSLTLTGTSAVHGLPSATANPRFEDDDFEPTPAPLDLSEIWQRLVDGSMTVTSHHTTQRSCYIEVAATEDSLQHRLTPGRLSLLERVLLGEGPKALAIDLNSAASTVSGALTQSLRRLGIQGTSRQLPLFLVMMAHVASGRISNERLGARKVQTHAGQCLIILDRPDYANVEFLSKAEQEVVHSLLGGESHAQIARARVTSRRTIANQVASAYSKLRVSGRLQLLCHVVTSAPEAETAKMTAEERR